MTRRRSGRETNRRPLDDVAFTADELKRLRLAAEHDGAADLQSFVQDAALEAAADVLDEDGPYDCPRDGCDEAFPTWRKLVGHLGSPAHALQDDDEAWCGRCGFGPTTAQGVRAHHGSSDTHDGSPVLLASEPDQEDLVDPVDVPDHKNSELLAELYEEHDGSYTAMCRAHDFDVNPGRVRHYLVKFGIHEVTPHGTGDDTPDYRDRDQLADLYAEHDGNISAMHRTMQADDELPDVPYRTLTKWLRKLEIHDPAERSPSGSDDVKDASNDETASESEGDSDSEADIEETETSTEPVETESEEFSQSVDEDDGAGCWNCGEESFVETPAGDLCEACGRLQDQEKVVADGGESLGVTSECCGAPLRLGNQGPLVCSECDRRSPLNPAREVNDGE